MRIIKKRLPTYKITITGVITYVEALKNYLQKHDDHPNVQVFLENCESKNVYLSWHDLLTKSIDLCKERSNHFNKECTTFHLNMTLGEDPNLNKRFCNILSGSCFFNVLIDCNSTSFHVFNHYLKNYCHIFDILDFQKKVSVLRIEHVTFTPIHADLLNDFHNLGELNFEINEVNLEDIKNRIVELTQIFKQANFQQLYTFRLFENSSFGYTRDLISAWIDLLAVIPSKN